MHELPTIFEGCGRRIRDGVDVGRAATLAFFFAIPKRINFRDGVREDYFVWRNALS